MKKFKEKLTLYFNTLCDELRTLIDHRKNMPKTPRLKKLCSALLCISFIAYLFLGLFGCLKVSAVDVGSSCTLSGVWRLNSTLSNTNSFVTSTPQNVGVSFTSNSQTFDIMYLYPSSGLFLRYEPNVGDPLLVYSPSHFDDSYWRADAYRIVDFGDTPQTVSSDFYLWFTSNAEPFITDLTGYTVTVPSGWSAFSGYGVFDLTGSFNGTSTMVSFLIGFSRTNNIAYSAAADIITWSLGGRLQSDISPSDGFTLYIKSGNDVGDSSLIQWLYDNDATFSIEQEEDRITDLSGYTVSVPAGWVQDGLSSSYTRFSLSCDLTYIDSSGSVNIPSVTSVSSSLYNNYFAIDFNHAGGTVTLYNGEIFILKNISGSSSTDSSLISWLYYNNATFTRDPDEELVSLDGSFVFNLNLVLDDGSLDEPQWNQDVSFVSNDVVYANMVNQSSQLRYGSTVVYDAYNGGWVDDSYRSVVFLNAAVPLWFYRWVNRNSSPVEPSYSLYGSYVLTNPSVESDSLITFDNPFSANGVDFVSIRFTDSADGDTVSYLDADGNEVVVYGSTGYSKSDYAVIYFGTDTSVSSDTYTLFNGYYTDLDDISYGNLIYYAGQENGERLGIIKGRSEGYQDGYDEGYTVGYGEGFALVEDGFMSNFFGGIIDALDALTIFGPLSALDILQTVLGFFIALWLLKLIAGG